MKVFVVENNYGECRPDESGWFILADSAMSNTGKPFYTPENLGKVEVALAQAVKVSRLGKHVAEKFAERYYDSTAPALLFSLPDYKRKLTEAGLPPDAARNFDRALVVADFMPKGDEARYELRINNQPATAFENEKLCRKVENLIPELSFLNTLKMGDVIVAGMTAPLEIRPGDILEVFNGDERSFHVKVK